jgi:predicted nucleotide-binding protein
MLYQKLPNSRAIIVDCPKTQRGYIYKVIDTIYYKEDSMSDELIREIELLIEEGKSFNARNSTVAKSLFSRDYELTEKYQIWKTEVENLIIYQFGENSSLYYSFSEGDSEHEECNFNKAHGYIIGSLRAALNTIRFVAKTKRGETRGEKTPAEAIREINREEGIPIKDGKKVFIVHGHDERLKNQLEIFLTEIGLEPVILHRKPDEGLTVIEKFEKHSDVGYAFILLTPDDISYSASEENTPDEEKKREMRARQNVIWEFGFFVGRLGRNKVCCLYKEGVTLPTDIHGMLYKKITDRVEEVAFAILKDLRAAGYDLQIS